MIRVPKGDSITVAGFELYGPLGRFRPLAPIDYLVDSIIPRGTVGMLAGFGGSLKSWTALALGVSIAGGGKWLGKYRCRPGRVAYFDWESSNAFLARRVQLLTERTGCKNWPARFRICSPPGVTLDLPEGLEARLMELAKRHALIVIDSFRAAAPSVSENDASSAIPLDLLRRVARATGCSFLVIHHTKKPGKGASGDARSLIRGSGSIFAALDFALVITKVKAETFRVDHVKARDDAEVDPFQLILEVDSEGARIFASPLRTKNHEKFDSETCDRILEFVHLHKGCSKNEVIKHVGGASKTARACIEHLMEEGRLINRGEGQKQELYAAKRPKGQTRKAGGQDSGDGSRRA